MTPYNNQPNVFSDTVKSNGVNMNVLVYLPPDYKTNAYPLFWFWNGRGEDTGPVSQLAVWGPFSFISSSWQPNFIVVAVQGLEWGPSTQVDQVYASLKAAYNFSDNVIASGLSDGGYGVTKLASFYPASVAAGFLKAIIPMSTAEGFGSAAVAPTVASKMAVWAFGDDPGDVHGVNTHNFLTALVAANPKGSYRWTNTNPDGHGGWNKHYDPSYKENGMNIYDWGMQFVKPATTTPVITQPIPPISKSIIFSISLADGKKFTLFSDGSYTLA